MSSLGLLYATGHGVLQNDAAAFGWFDKAADAGHGYAMYELGRFYETGRGVDQNFNLALLWYQKAAAHGHVAAMAAIGRWPVKPRGTRVGWRRWSGRCAALRPHKSKNFSATMP